MPKGFAGLWEDLDDKARELVFPDEFYYNSWVESYNAEEYLDAIEKFIEVDCEDKQTEICFKTNHNLWNSLYYFSFEVADEVKVKNYEKAIKAYQKVLDIKEDDQTKANKEFVEEKLKKLKEKLDKQEINIKQDNKSWWKDNTKNNFWNKNQDKNQENQQQNNNQDNQNQQQEQDNKEEKPQNRNWDNAPVEEVPDYVNESRIWQDLTDAEKQSMKARLDYLLKDSALNADAFGKKRDPNEAVRNRLFWDFENEFWFWIDQNQEKDW